MSGVPGRPRGARTRRGLALAVLVAAICLAPIGAATAASPHAADSDGVVAITQSSGTTSTGTFTVSVQVADPSSVQLAYFSFCQITHALCYADIGMTLQNTDWFVGTTEPMSSYPGMNPGVHAGYNITIEYPSDNNVTEPNLPNAFGTLTVATSVTGEYMFEMGVRPAVFGLQGTVTNASSGRPVAGALVNLTPGTNSTTTNSAGDYSFSNLFNGSYTLAVTAPGYRPFSQAVTIGGKNVQQALPISSTYTPSTGTGSGTKGGGSSSPAPLLSGDVLYGIGAAVAVAAVLLIALLASRRNRTRPPAADPGPVPPKEP